MFSNKLFNSCSLSCCLLFVTTLRATGVSFLRLVFAPLKSSRLIVSFPFATTSYLVFLFIAATGCPDVDLEVLATAGCPCVGREMLATGFPNDWLDQTMSYQLIQMTSFAIHPRLTMVWGEEVINCLTRAHREVNSDRQSFDEVLKHHIELEMQLEELEAIGAQEKRAAEAQTEALEAQRKKLTAERAALAVEKEALASEKKTVEAELEGLAAKNVAVEVRLDETRARAEGEIQSLRAENEPGCPVVGREMLATGFHNDCFLLVIPSQRASADLAFLLVLFAPAGSSSP
ncbi:hypothetical protein F511_33998 [Dorcoceras hygrometricum]|uniref:Uncharacterized protein n=1 Tax=Dorcoceras hygrometricum TaxID=472368 RepID=A0A2Z7BGQ5_9LAMI|nr:hypothetical protein F511_33998 [Dorcoceras hygrometricum]